MTVPPFLRFTAVPLKARHDGWTPELQLRFIVALARGHSIAAAARLVGKTRATAYALRQRPGAESFAATWDAALAHAKRTRIVSRRSPPPPLPAPAHDRRSAEVLLDTLYPGWRGQAAKAIKTDEADRR